MPWTEDGDRDDLEQQRDDALLLIETLEAEVGRLTADLERCLKGSAASATPFWDWHDDRLNRNKDF